MVSNIIRSMNAVVTPCRRDPSGDVLLPQLCSILNLLLGLRELCDAFDFSVGQGNSCCPGSPVFLLELSEQNVFCILENNEGAF